MLWKDYELYGFGRGMQSSCFGNIPLLMLYFSLNSRACRSLRDYLLTVVNRLYIFCSGYLKERRGGVRKRIIFLSYVLVFLNSFQRSWKWDIIILILLLMKLRSSEVPGLRVFVQSFHLWTVCCVAHTLCLITYILTLREGLLFLNRRRNNSVLNNIPYR